MGFGCILQHLTSRFAALCLAFCCILACVLLHFALRFGAKYTAFWCILQCVLVLNALQHPAIKPHFLVVTDANLGEFSSKRNAKA